MDTISIPKNCMDCGKVFTYTGYSTLCDECRKKDNQEFSRVKDYLWEHPNSSITAVSTELGISVMKIRRYINEERVDITGIGKTKSYCQNCFAIIPSGTYCPICEKEFSKAGNSKETQTNKDSVKYKQPSPKPKPNTDNKNFIFK